MVKLVSIKFIAYFMWHCALLIVGVGLTVLSTHLFNNRSSARLQPHTLSCLVERTELNMDNLPDCGGWSECHTRKWLDLIYQRDLRHHQQKAQRNNTDLSELIRRISCSVFFARRALITAVIHLLSDYQKRWIEEGHYQRQNQWTICLPARVSSSCIWQEEHSALRETHTSNIKKHTSCWNIKRCHNWLEIC